MEKVAILTLIFLLTRAACAQEEDATIIRLRESESKIKSDIILKDPSTIPEGKIGVNISLSVNIMERSHESTWTLHVVMKMRWNDKRLIHFPPGKDEEIRSVTFGPELINKIWIPPVYFEDTVRQEQEDKNSFLLVKLEDGDVEYISMRTVTILCPMYMELFPYDIPVCTLRLSSYVLTIRDLEFNWDEDFKQEANKSRTETTTRYGEYILHGINMTSCESVTAIGKHTCLQMDLTQLRKSTKILFQIFFPMTFLLVVSWLGYFLHPTKHSSARAIIVISTFCIAVMVLQNFHGFTHGQNKLIDHWTSFVMWLMLWAVTQFAIVNNHNMDRSYYVKRKPIKKEEENRNVENIALNIEGENTGGDGGENAIEVGPVPSFLDNCRFDLHLFLKYGLDQVTIFLAPFLFLVYTAAYILEVLK